MIRDPTITLVSSFNTQFYNLNDFILDQKAPNLKKKKKNQKANKKNKANQTKKTPSIYSYYNQDLVDYENIDSFTHVPDVFHFIWWYPHLTFETQKHIWVTIVSLCSYGNYEQPPGAAQWASKMLLQAVRAPTNHPWGWC